MTDKQNDSDAVHSFVMLQACSSELSEAEQKLKDAKLRASPDVESVEVRLLEFQNETLTKQVAKFEERLRGVAVPDPELKLGLMRVTHSEHKEPRTIRTQMRGAAAIQLSAAGIGALVGFSFIVVSRRRSRRVERT